MVGKTYAFIVRFDTFNPAAAMLALTQMPPGYAQDNSAFSGMTLDPVSRSLWLIPRTANMIVKVSTGTHTKSGSLTPPQQQQEVPATPTKTLEQKTATESLPRKKTPTTSVQPTATEVMAANTASTEPLKPIDASHLMMLGAPCRRLEAGCSDR